MESKPFSDTLVFALVFVISILIAGYAVAPWLTGKSTAEFISGIIRPCKELPVVKSARMAIIRIDDVQAYSLEDISIKMIDDAKSRGIPLVLGVIPKAMDETTPISQYLKKNRCWLEIAQHGWDHQGVTPDTPEFSGVDETTALADIERGKQILEKITEEKLTTFIPPLNRMSDGARRAAATTGIRIISSEGSGAFDYSASTYNYLTDTLNAPETILRDCNRRVARRLFCVVMIHPQDFVTNNELDPNKYAIYLDTLDGLQAAGYSFVRFKDLAEQE